MTYVDNRLNATGKGLFSKKYTITSLLSKNMEICINNKVSVHRFSDTYRLTKLFVKEEEFYVLSEKFGA